jgi:hypothetical protein
MTNDELMTNPEWIARFQRVAITCRRMLATGRVPVVVAADKVGIPSLLWASSLVIPSSLDIRHSSFSWHMSVARHGNVA